MNFKDANDNKNCLACCLQAGQNFFQTIVEVTNFTLYLHHKDVWYILLLPTYLLNRDHVTGSIDFPSDDCLAVEKWMNFTGIDPGRLDEGGIAAIPGDLFACYY